MIIVVLTLIIFVSWFWNKSLEFRPKLNPSETLELIRVLKITDGKYRKIIKHRELIHKNWNKLLERVKSGDERDLRLAIIEADGLVDEVLKEHGHPGNDMGERMKSIHPSEFGNINELWEAHKIRNRLVHEADFHLQMDEYKKIISVYHRVLEELLSRELELI